MREVTRLVEEELDTLWETAIELYKLFISDEYTSAQYLEEKQSALKDSLEVIDKYVYGEQVDLRSENGSNQQAVR